MGNKRSLAGLQIAFLDSLSLHIQVSFLKERCREYRSSLFIESFALKRLFQSPKLPLDDLVLERAIPLSRRESTRVPNAIFYRIKYRATFATTLTKAISGVVFLCSRDKQTDALEARFPRLRRVYERSPTRGFSNVTIGEAEQ